MSLGIGHFAVGATVTTITLWLLFPTFQYTRSIPIFGGIWAMLPDVGKLAPFETEAVLAFHNSTAANLFWGHHFLDAVDSGDSPEVAALALVVLLVVTLLSERNEARHRHQTTADPASQPGEYPR